MSLEAENFTESEVAETINIVEEDGDSLDSFFKKKDKKGKKKKSKKTETGSTGKESTTKTKKKESESKKDSENLREDGAAAQDHEEWNDFEDESERDYSDLKIQNLQTADDSAEVAEAPEYNEDGELILPKPAEGPWKNISSMQKQKSQPVMEKVQPAPAKKMGAYRPPQARAGGSSHLVPSSLPKRNARKQQVPEINNELDFPSLANAVQDVTPAGFEVVKHGTKVSSWHVMQQEKERASEIKLENQFAALNAGQ